MQSLTPHPQRKQKERTRKRNPELYVAVSCLVLSGMQEKTKTTRQQKNRFLVFKEKRGDIL